MIAFVEILIGAILLGSLVYFSPKYVPMTTYNLAGIAAVALVFIGIIIHGFYSLERKHIEQPISEPVDQPQPQQHPEQEEQHYEQEHQQSQHEE